MDCRLLGSSANGISQPRILEGVAMPSSRGSSQHRDQAQVSRHWRFFTIWATSEGHFFFFFSISNLKLFFRVKQFKCEVVKQLWTEFSETLRAVKSPEVEGLYKGCRTGTMYKGLVSLSGMAIWWGRKSSLLDTEEFEITKRNYASKDMSQLLLRTKLYTNHVP